MKTILLILFCLVPAVLKSQTGSVDREQFLNKSDLDYLEGLTREVLESSRIYPGQFISEDYGSNKTNGVLIRPGGRDCYPAFWIRDYAMSLDCGFVSESEQKHMLLLTASTQCDQMWISNKGSLVPQGSIADHIRIDDGKPIYFPGTYDYYNQGSGKTPPYCDQFYFIHMAYYYVNTNNSPKILMDEINGIRMIDRLEMAFRVPPTRQEGVLVYTTEDYRGIDYGFRDCITITGDLSFPSILKYKAALELAEIFEKIKNNKKAEDYQAIADRLKVEIPRVFSDSRGMLRAATGISRQPDVWGTALAVYFGILDGDNLKKACTTLSDAYENGTLASRGNIRHVLTTDDFNESTAWEGGTGVKKNVYQNGAYWGTATGWVCYAIEKVNKDNAQKLAKEYVNDLRENDYRKGGKFGAPYECFHSDYSQNPLYLATVTCPYVVFSNKKY